MWCIPSKQSAEFVCAMENVLARQCLDRRIPDKATLVREIGAWESERNAMRKPVNWRYTTDDARIKLKRLYPQIQE